MDEKMEEKIELTSHKKVRVVIMIDELLANQIELEVKSLQDSSGRKNIRSEVYETIVRKGLNPTSPEKASLPVTSTIKSQSNYEKKFLRFWKKQKNKTKRKSPNDYKNKHKN